MNYSTYFFISLAFAVIGIILAFANIATAPGRSFRTGKFKTLKYSNIKEISTTATTITQSMKIAFTSILLFLALTLAAFAQNETVQVDITKLSSQELLTYQQLRQKQAQFALENLSPETINKYSQMGKGIGVAINEGLGAVTENVEEFSQTSAGKWLMVIITWKVMGNDVIGFSRTILQWIIGSILFIVGIPFWIWLIRCNCVNAPIASVEKIGFWRTNVVYKNCTPIHYDDILLYGMCFIVFMGIIAFITFIH